MGAVEPCVLIGRVVLEVLKMMVEVTLGVFGVALAALWATMWVVKMRVEAQTVAIVQAVKVIEDIKDVAENLASTNPIDEVIDVIDQTFSNMHVPTGQDHMQAAMASGLNLLFAKLLGGMDIGSMIGGGALPEQGSYPPTPEP